MNKKGETEIEQQKKMEEAEVRQIVSKASQFGSCFQEIARTSCFTVGMFGRLTPALRASGPHAYRRLHWEAGLIGSILYLEAEAQGLGATGMGCYLDNVALSQFGFDGGCLSSHKKT